MRGRVSRAVWVVRAVLLLAVVAGLARLRFDTEVLALLPAELEVARGLIQYQRHFTDARQLVVTVEAGDPEEAAAAARHLAGVFRGHTAWISAADWQPPWLERPGELAELTAYLWLQADPERFGELARRLSAGGRGTVLTEARERLATSLSPDEIVRLARDPFGLLTLDTAGPAPGAGGDPASQPFASADGRLRVVFVESACDLASYPACIEWLHWVRATVDAERAAGRIPASVRTRFTGRPVFVTEIAGGMERDMTGSMSGTLATIAVLFWLTHRRWRPLGWLVLALILVQGLTLALAGLWLGRINVVSLGFGAILFGLAEDFGVLIYQEARSHPGRSVGDLRRAVLPGIAWSAVTTAGAFLLLNLSHLPGLAQLGTLVALGVTVAAGVMVLWYLPQVHASASRDAAGNASPATPEFRRFTGMPQTSARALRWASMALVLSAGILLAFRGPTFDRSPNVLAPRHSEAREALARIRESIGGGRDPLWLLVSGKDDQEVRDRLERLETSLGSARERGAIAGYRLPTDLWPNPADAARNLAVARALAAERDGLAADLDRHGFQAGAGEFTRGVLEAWSRMGGPGGVGIPEGHTLTWILKQVRARTPDGPVALGAVEQPAGTAGGRGVLEGEVSGVLVAGWELLGTEVFRLALADLPWVLGPVIAVVVVSLGVAYRNGREVVLTLSILAASGLILAAALGLLGIAWNLMNLLAIPLMLGMGVDFCIHMQLALRREEGDSAAVRASVGRALLLAGSTTVAGFASLAFSSNAGLASLGLVCALGIAITLAVAVFLLPAWWAPPGRAAGSPARRAD